MSSNVKKMIDAEIKRIRTTFIKPSEKVNRYLADQGATSIDKTVCLDQLLKRAQLNYDSVEVLAESPEKIDHSVSRQVEIEIKYEGYIQRQLKEIEKFRHLERIVIPEGFDFKRVHGLSNELMSKLSVRRPDNLGQASRIDGMTPAGISVLMVAIKSGAKKAAAGP